MLFKNNALGDILNAMDALMITSTVSLGGNIPFSILFNDIRLIPNVFDISFFVRLYLFLISLMFWQKVWISVLLLITTSKNTKMCEL